MNNKELNLANTQARKNLALLFDDDYSEIDAFSKTASGDAEVVIAFGYIAGTPAYAFAQDADVDGGAISMAHCAKIKKLYELAVKTGAPVVGIYNSKGLRLKEGFGVLRTYSEILELSTAISGVVPQISIIEGNCSGALAMVAAAADVLIMTKAAKLALVPTASGSADECLAGGTAALLADDISAAIDQAKTVLSYLPVNNLSPAPVSPFDEAPSADFTSGAKALINSVADNNSPIYFGSEYAGNTVTALATMAGAAAAFIAFDGQAIDDAQCAKAAKFVRFCDAYSLPVITLLDADGFADSPTVLSSATKLASIYSQATTAKITLVTGNAIGAPYALLAASSSDAVFAWNSAVLSPLKPEAAVAVLQNDRLAAGENKNDLLAEYIATEASPLTAAAQGNVQDVFEPALTRSKLLSALDMLAGKRVSTLPKKHSVI